jgi:hypothetical protein
MDKELDIFTPTDIYKKDLKNIDKTIDSTFNLLFDLSVKEIDSLIKKNNIVKYNEQHNEPYRNNQPDV